MQLAPHAQQTQTHVPLMQQAFNVFANVSQQLAFILDVQCCVLDINNFASDCLQLPQQMALHQPLQDIFLQQGWVPPHLTMTLQEDVRISHTKIQLPEKEIMIQWQLMPLRAAGTVAGYLLLGKTQQHPEATIATPTTLIAGLNQHLHDLSQLSEQTLLDTNKDAFELRAVLQTVHRSLQQTQKLLKFAASLQQSNAEAQGQIDLKQLLNTIINDYQAESGFANVGIYQEYLTTQSLNVVGNQAAWQQGIEACLLPLLQFLQAGSVKLQIQISSAANRQNVLQLQLKLSGADAFGHSIGQWLAADNAIKGHRSLQLHLSLGQAWVESMFGTMQTHMHGDDAVIQIILPCCVHITQMQVQNVVQDGDQNSFVSTQYQQQHLAQLPTKDILLVEDNSINCKAITKFKNNLFAHLSLDIANSAAEAQEKFQQYNYRLIIMDIGLPDSEGLNLATSLRTLEQTYQRKRTPICVVSAHFQQTDDPTFHLSVEEGRLVDAYYKKPLSMQHFEKVVLQWVPTALSAGHSLPQAQHL